MRFVLLLTALCGLAVSLVLVRLGLPSHDPGARLGSAMCSPSARINCDYVLASRWARIGPIPTSVAGLAYFAVLGVWFAAVGVPNVAGRRWHRVPLALIGLGACTSLWFVYVMAVHLPFWCTWCLAAHGINGLLLVLVVVAWLRLRLRVAAADSSVAPHPSTARVGIVLTGCIGLALLIASSVYGYQMSVIALRLQTTYLKATNNPEYVLWRYSLAPQRDVPVASDDFMLGPPDAPHTLVVFSDFECPNCAGFHRYAGRLVTMFPTTLRIVFKHFPLCRDCNSKSQSMLHVFACEAARAAAAFHEVATPSQTFAFHQQLFENAYRFDARPYEKLAADSGVDIDKWRRALAGEMAAAAVKVDVELAHRLDVDGTPALFLDGKRLEAWRLVTTDAGPQVELSATDKLWESLLGTPARYAPTSRAASD